MIRVAEVKLFARERIPDLSATPLISPQQLKKLMPRFSIFSLTFVILSALLTLGGCSQQKSGATSPPQPQTGSAPAGAPAAQASAQPAQPQASAQPSASVNPAISAAMSKPGVPVMVKPGEKAASPAAQSKPGATAQSPAAIPNSIPERLRRPLTLEEINQLPPETRDMILRAQGRLATSPAPKKK